MPVDYLDLDLAHRTIPFPLDRILAAQTFQRMPGSIWHEPHQLSQLCHLHTSTPWQIHEWFQAYISVNLRQIAVAVELIAYQAVRYMHLTHSMVPQQWQG